MRPSLPLAFLALCAFVPAIAQQGPPPATATPAAASAGPDEAAALAALQANCPAYAAALAETDPRKQQALLHQAIACIQNKKKIADAQAVQTQAISKENLKLLDQLNSLATEAAGDPAVQAVAPPVRHKAESKAPHAVSSAEPTPPGTPAPAAPSNLDAAPPAQQSAYATPSACTLGTDTAARATGQALLTVHRQLLREQDVQDDFGYRLGKRFLVYQVTVTNASKDFQYEISDISVDLKDVLTLQGAQFLQTSAAVHEASSETLDMLRGVPEKGQDLDPRNLTVHVLQGIGAVAGGVSGLTPFSDTMGAAMANFNGAFIQAITGIAPDHTATQLNRLSDMAFSSNTLIGKLQAKTYAVFIPKSFVLTKDNVTAFHKDPRSLLNWLPLDQVNVCVDGILLVQVATVAAPVFSSDVPRVAPGTSISLTDGTPAADIYYTTNNDTPTTTSSKYSSAFTMTSKLGDQLHIRAFAVAPNLSPSNVVTQTFTVAAPAGKPVFAASTDGKTLTITPALPTDAVYYTTDGTTPGVNSNLYNPQNPIPLDTTKTYKAVAIGNDTAYSPVVTYTVAPAAANP